MKRIEAIREHSPTPTTADLQGSKGQRLAPLDALRGLIVVLMALDHANHFVAQRHSSGEYWGGPFPVYSPAYNDALAFLTRLVTHLCAPGFFFLMGASMVLFARSRRERGWDKWHVASHFLLRGGLLIALQFMLVNRAWELSPGGWTPQAYAGVLFALGGAMVLGGGLLWLEPPALLALSAALMLGTELLTPDAGMWYHPYGAVSRLLLIPGGTRELWVNYPILPWLGLATFGMAFGHWLVDEPRRAFERGLRLGSVFVLAFLVLRALGGFGNIRPRAGNTWIDFLNVVKYPPSITFNLLTMGLNLVVLGLFAHIEEHARRPLEALRVLGRTPLFFYLAHLFLYAGMAHLLTPGGTSIPGMVPYWLLGLLILYPACLWYGRLKQRHPASPILRFL